MPRTARDHRDPLRDRPPGLLGRAPQAAPGHALRQLRERRPAQRPGIHAPWRSLYQERLRRGTRRRPGRDLWDLAVASLFRGHVGDERRPLRLPQQHGPVFGWGLESDKKDPSRGRVFPKLLDEWRRLAPNYWGDFWPLTPYSIDQTAWIAWQYDRPEAGEGVVQAFRRADCGAETAAPAAPGTRPRRRLHVANFDISGTVAMTDTS